MKKVKAIEMYLSDKMFQNIIRTFEKSPAHRIETVAMITKERDQQHRRRRRRHGK